MKSLHGGCRKFLLLFGRIGPLALRPCALLPRVFLLPHSKNILQIPWWYGDMVCLALALAPSCAALHFWCLYIMLSKSCLPRRCDWKDGFFLWIPTYLGLSWQSEYPISPSAQPSFKSPLLGESDGFECTMTFHSSCSLSPRQTHPWLPLFHAACSFWCGWFHDATKKLHHEHDLRP